MKKKKIRKVKADTKKSTATTKKQKPQSPQLFGKNSIWRRLGLLPSLETY